MSFEYLMCRDNNCEREGIKGTDADVYRRMEMADRNLTNPNWNKSNEEKEYDYRNTFSEVRGYVYDAKKRGLNDIGYKLSTSEEQNLQMLLSKLTHSFYDKKELYKSISQAADIFRNHGLEAR